jgi:hypothetical protein
VVIDPEEEDLRDEAILFVYRATVFGLVLGCYILLWNIHDRVSSVIVHMEGQCGMFCVTDSDVPCR